MGNDSDRHDDLDRQSNSTAIKHMSSFVVSDGASIRNLSKNVSLSIKGFCLGVIILMKNAGET
ncbi:hypothetical protein TorRG33x02_326620 [Trema orientale]|uniref:Uncharacterized protein n=1 Tax=Trema orientale TaxID=63057 RepID=A0A2P5BBS2_TREOI|nr:hypothetical protein TorRG33x02_326620 [Trema orientale]